MKAILFIILLLPSVLLAQFNKRLVFMSRYQKATQLNGATQYWQRATPDSVRFGGYSVLMMAWVKTNASANQMIVAKYESNVGKRSMALTIETGPRPYVWVSGDGNTGVSRELATTIIAGKWYHIAALFYASNLNIYIDGSISNGSLTGTAPASLFDPVGTPLTVGVNGNLSTGFFNGTIGEVQIVRFASLPSGLSDIIKRNAQKATFDKTYTSGEVVFWTEWNGGGLDKSGKGNHLAGAGDPQILSIKR
jgi:hypothetical protein